MIVVSSIVLLVTSSFKSIINNKKYALSTLKFTTKSIGDANYEKFLKNLHPSLDETNSNGFKGNPASITHHILINKEKHSGLTLNQVIENETFLNTCYINKLIKWGSIYTSSTPNNITTTITTNSCNNKPQFNRLLNKSALEEIINENIERIRIHQNPLRRPHAWQIDWNDTILFETDDYIAINKPPAIATHESVDNFYENAKYQILNLIKTRENSDSKEVKEMNLYPVGRLDIPSTGVLIFPKTPSFANKIFSAMKEGKVVKEYHALSHQKVPVGMIKHAHKKIKGPLVNPTLLKEYDQQLLQIDDDLHVEIENIAKIINPDGDIVVDRENGEASANVPGVDLTCILGKRSHKFMLLLRELEKRQVKTWKKALKEWRSRSSSSSSKDDDNDVYPYRSQWKLAALQVLSCTSCSSSNDNSDSNDININDDWQWKWQDHYPLDDMKDYSRYEDVRRPLYESHIQLLTGRTHQIRLQLAALNAAIIGDVQYIPAEGMYDTSTTTITYDDYYNNYYYNNNNNYNNNSSSSSSKTTMHGDGRDVFGVKPDHIGLHCSAFKIPHLNIDIRCAPPWRG